MNPAAESPLTLGAEAERGLTGRARHLSTQLLHERFQIILVLFQFAHRDEFHTSQWFIYRNYKT